jgi:hypothetical protein
MQTQMQTIGQFQKGKPIPLSAYRRQVLRIFDAQRPILDSRGAISGICSVESLCIELLSGTCYMPLGAASAVEE